VLLHALPFRPFHFVVPEPYAHPSGQYAAQKQIFEDRLDFQNGRAKTGLLVRQIFLFRYHGFPTIPPYPNYFPPYMLFQIQHRAQDARVFAGSPELPESGAVLFQAFRYRATDCGVYPFARVVIVDATKGEYFNVGRVIRGKVAARFATAKAVYSLHCLASFCV
jgi:hypothetical protein